MRFTRAISLTALIAIMIALFSAQNVEAQGGQKPTSTPTVRPGSELVATLTQTSARGTLMLANNRRLQFSVDLVTEPAGLRRAEFTIGGAPYVAGWIILPTGAQRGAVKARMPGAQPEPATLIAFPS